jgi:predicted TPR repeat methyltransferase
MVGVDLSPKMVEKSRAKGAYDVLTVEDGHDTVEVGGGGGGGC